MKSDCQPANLIGNTVKETLGRIQNPRLIYFGIESQPSILLKNLMIPGFL